MTQLIHDLVPGSDQWLIERRKYICGSDSPRILGFSRYGGPYDVWLEKQPVPPEQIEPTVAMMRGLQLQPVIARAYELHNDVKLLPEAFAISKEYPFMASTPDARIVGQIKHLQIKTHLQFLADEYGEPGSDEVPLSEFTQVTHECAVLGSQEADLVVLFATEKVFDMLQWAWANFSNSPKEADEIASYALNCMDYRQYTIKRDPDLEAELVGVLKTFYEENMVAGIIPPSAPTLQDSGGIRTATEDEASLIINMKNGFLQERQGKAAKELAKDQLIHHIGGDTGIDSAIGKITYKLAKKGKVSHKDVAEILRLRIDLSDEEYEHLQKTCTSKPTRSFVYPWQRWGKEI